MSDPRKMRSVFLEEGKFSHTLASAGKNKPTTIDPLHIHKEFYIDAGVSISTFKYFRLYFNVDLTEHILCRLKFPSSIKIQS